MTKHISENALNLHHINKIRNGSFLASKQKSLFYTNFSVPSSLWGQRQADVLNSPPCGGSGSFSLRASRSSCAACLATCCRLLRLPPPRTGCCLTVSHVCRLRAASQRVHMVTPTPSPSPHHCLPRPKDPLSISSSLLSLQHVSSHSACCVTCSACW